MKNNSSTPTVNDTQIPISTKAIKKIGDRIGFNYVVLKSLKKSQKNDVVKCFYMKSISKFGFCVIKEGSINDAKDRFGRDIKERLVWQEHLHQVIQSKVRVPKLIGSFEENGNFYLVIEHISGKSLAELLKIYGAKIRRGLVEGSNYGIKILKYLVQCAVILRDLHNMKMAHRDATAANFMISITGKVYLIDLELCYSIDEESPTPPFLLGTHGYMSPEQLQVQVPTIKEDVFAFGALLLSAWSNLPPVILTEPLPESLTDKISYFVRDAKMLDLITKCLLKEPENRPNMKTIITTLKEYILDIKKNKKRILITIEEPSLEDIRPIIQSTINALSGPIFSDFEKGWFAENIKPNKEKSSTLSKGWYASFYIGGSGILYFLSKAKIFGYDVCNAQHNVEKLLNLIEKKYIQTENPRSGLHFGCHGIAVSLAYAVDSGILEKNGQWTEWIFKLIMQEDTKLIDIMNGLSGQVLACINIYHRYPNDDLKEKITANVKTLIEAQQLDGSWSQLSKTVKGKTQSITGFAYGIAGVVYALLVYGQQFNDTASITSAEKGLVWLIKNAKWAGASIHWAASARKKINPWWIDGATGISLTFLKAFEITQNKIYKRYYEAVLSPFSEDTWNNNFSQSNGMVGLGEVYIEAFKVFKEEVWLSKAISISRLLIRTFKLHPDSGSYWLTENQYAIPGFMLGNSGVLHFLLRILNYQQIGVPLTPDLNDVGANNRYLKCTPKHESPI